MTNIRHAVLVCDALGLPYIMGTSAASDVLNAPLAGALDPVPVLGGIGAPARSANGLFAFGGWAQVVMPDSAGGANDGTIAVLAQRTATARAAGARIDDPYYGPADGGVSPTWQSESVWINGGGA